MESQQPAEVEGFSWMVCHDGSEISVQCLKEVRYSLMNEKKDKLYVAHVWSEEKNEYLPHHYKLDFIKNACDTDCIALPGRYTFLPKQNVAEECKSTKQILNAMANENNVDVCVVGYHGRKGFKDDPTVMGSAV